MAEQIQVEPESPNTRVRIHCKGDLVVEGWERSLIEVGAQGGRPVVDLGEEQVEIEADSSCAVRLPEMSAEVEIAAGGRVQVKGLRGALDLGQVKGDLVVEGVGSVKIESAAGRVNLLNVAGDVQVQKRARGDLSAEEIGGGISIAAVAGRLTLKDVAGVQAGSVGGDVTVEGASAGVEIGRADGNVRLDNVGGAATLEKTLGDASLRGVRGRISCGQVSGRLHLADVEEVTVKQVMGDLSAEGVRGGLACQKAHGRAKLRNVDGSISLGGVGGDLVVEGCGGMLSANCGGRAVLAGIAGNVRVNAGGDVRCSLPEPGSSPATVERAVGASVRAVCGGSLRVVGGAESIDRGPGAHRFTIGDGKNSCALITGGGIRLQIGQSSLPVAKSARDMRSATGKEEMGGADDELSELDESGDDSDLGAMGARIAATVSQKISSTLRKKLKRKLREVGKRAADGEWADAHTWSFQFDEETPPRQSFGDIDIDVDVESEEADDTVSIEERMTVLRMLEGGKISAAEAEQLLEALVRRDAGAGRDADGV